MAAKKKKRKKKIIRFPGGFHLNIGIIVFSFVAFYFAYNIYSYLTIVHVSPYEVEQGTIEINTSYTGLIIRNETVVNAEQSGSLDYYLKDNTKASSGTLICSIDENGNISERLNEAVDSSAVLTEENMNSIQSSIREYVKGYQDSAYYTTYNFKSDLSGRLTEALNLGALNAISEYTEFAKDNQTFHLYHAQQPGIVAYYADGMENLTPEIVTANMFDQSAHQKTSFKTEGTVEAGQPVYKLISDEAWQIAVIIDADMKRNLQGSDMIQIRFKEDHTTAWASYTIERKAGQDFLFLTFHNSMIRFANERYIDINILLNQQTGLKIPNSAITTKAFELVPDAYFTQGSGTGNQTGLLVEHRQSDGTYTEAEFIPATVYYEDEENEMAYISQENIQRGDRVVKTGTTDRYDISKTARLRGVYNINRGYAMFRQIDEIFSNNSYTVVKAGTEYGIMLYDHIALDGDSVTEDQMIIP